MEKSPAHPSPVFWTNGRAAPQTQYSSAFFPLQAPSWQLFVAPTVWPNEVADAFGRSRGADPLAVQWRAMASSRTQEGDGEGAGACFIPWSMRQPFPGARARPHDISCIVCFAEQGADVDWHGCRTCSAAWCDDCMAQMHDAARDHEDDVELSCPQCRGSIAGMQMQGRLERITAADGLGCTEEQAHEVVAYENLLSELVHLAQCDASGLPYFTQPAATVAT